MSQKNANDLIRETSPYLLQHAYNPVKWMPWIDASLNRAESDGKLLLISIGYSACHWCHVMEEECFEDDTVAQVMNDNFINIKVDREERPDVDQIYMNAVQLMTGRGGWPLNIVALPDGRPVWGATYVPKKQWKGALNQLADLYKKSPETLIEYAIKLNEGMHAVSLFSNDEEASVLSLKGIEIAVSTWEERFDYELGGTIGAPKFMMPNNLSFLLRYAHQTGDEKTMSYVLNSLDKISYGGIYDHVDGGFSRYSVDDKWHVPHFEKMLYDNAQLVSLYAEAFSITKNDWYKTVVYETLSFVQKELTRENGSFYSALDADSLTAEDILVEGAYYVWTKIELEHLLKTDFDIFKDYYNVNDYGFWEDDNYVLIRSMSHHDVAKKHALTTEELQLKIEIWKESLSAEREKRKKPRLDDKSLTSWNALMLQAYLDAYNVFQEDEFLHIAMKNAQFIESIMLHENGRLWHSYNKNEAKINGYLEDYAATIQAFISLYSCTMNEKWLSLSERMTSYVFEHFYDEKSSMFYFNSNLDKALVTRPIEYQDNVIHASNSMMARNIFSLNKILNKPDFIALINRQLKNVAQDAKKYAGGYSNWLSLSMNIALPFYEIVIVGDNANELLKEIKTHYILNAVIAATETKIDSGLFKSRWVDGETLIYVCENQTCQLPVKTVEEAMSILTGSLTNLN